MRLFEIGKPVMMSKFSEAMLTIDFLGDIGGLDIVLGFSMVFFWNLDGSYSDGRSEKMVEL